jgi:hypothetical protein
VCINIRRWLPRSISTDAFVEHGCNNGALRAYNSGICPCFNNHRAATTINSSGSLDVGPTYHSRQHNCSGHKYHGRPGLCDGGTAESYAPSQGPSPIATTIAIVIAIAVTITVRSLAPAPAPANYFFSHLHHHHHAITPPNHLHHHTTPHHIQGLPVTGMKTTLLARLAAALDDGHPTDSTAPAAPTGRAATPCMPAKTVEQPPAPTIRGAPSTRSTKPLTFCGVKVIQYYCLCYYYSTIRAS